MYNKDEDYVMQENEFFLQIIIYIKDVQIIIEIIKIRSLVRKVQQQIRELLMNKEHNEIRYKILKQIKIRNHNCKLMSLKGK